MDFKGYDNEYEVSQRLGPWLMMITKRKATVNVSNVLLRQLQAFLKVDKI